MLILEVAEVGDVVCACGRARPRARPFRGTSRRHGAGPEPRSGLRPACFVHGRPRSAIRAGIEWVVATSHERRPKRKKLNALSSSGERGGTARFGYAQ